MRRKKKSFGDKALSVVYKRTGEGQRWTSSDISNKHLAPMQKRTNAMNSDMYWNECWWDKVCAVCKAPLVEDKTQNFFMCNQHEGEPFKVWQSKWELHHEKVKKHPRVYKDEPGEPLFSCEI